MDFTARNHGSITILTPVSTAGKVWANEHLPDDCPMWGPAGFAIESNYFPAIAEGIVADGLELN